MRQWTRSLKAGVEGSPDADEIGFVANWGLLEETARRPALILGTSSDEPIASSTPLRSP